MGRTRERHGDGGRNVDTLVGGKGDDELTGGPQTDLLRGNRGDDLQDGGLGDDHSFDGGPGRDVLWLGPCHDSAIHWNTDGERDMIRCGAGHDTVGYWVSRTPPTGWLGCELITDIAHSVRPAEPRPGPG